MTPQQMDELRGEFQEVAAAARALVGDCAAGELGRPPSPGAWSIADNLMHLTLASQGFVPRMRKTLGKLAGAGRRTERRSPADIVGRVYAWALEPPVHFRARAPRGFVPPPGTSLDDALPAFLAEQDHVIALVEQSAGLDLASRKVPSPISPRIRYNVYSAFRVLVAHQRRHLWQARRALEAVRAAGLR